MKKIAILGGSFDPVHSAHMMCVNEAIDELNLDKVLIIPTGRPPHKEISNPEINKHRLNMLKIAFKDINKTEVLDFELRNKNLSYTYLTIQYIKENYSYDKLYFLIGADMLMILDKWKKIDYLFENLKFAVFKRKGVSDRELNQKIEYLEKKFNTKILTIKSKAIDISSTTIRNNIAKDIGYSQHLEKGVYEYILKERLYAK